MPSYTGERARVDKKKSSKNSMATFLQNEFTTVVNRYITYDLYIYINRYIIIISFKSIV